MENKNCLYCYKPLENSARVDFHTHCNMDFFGMKQTPSLDYSLDQMSELARTVVERSIAVPGVQPKLSLSMVSDALENGGSGRLTVVGALGGNFIFKPPMERYPEMPQNEHLTMRIAEAFGIKTVKSSLIRLRSGELAYITKRIDRMENGEKVHMLDMFQILEAFDKYKSSMERVGKALRLYAANTLLDQLYFFELNIFSFVTGNNDMHLKNFSMINSGGDWSLAPAYDLLNVSIVNPEDTEELALTLEGKKQKFKREHFERLGKGLDLNDRQIASVFRRFENNKATALEWIDKSFLSEKLKGDYKSLLEARYKRLAS
jgi:serine/threonine-protein kinase HipA